MAIRKDTPSMKFDDIPGHLPKGLVPADVDIPVIAQAAVELLNHLEESDLHRSAIWRDLLAFTGYFRTFTGLDRVHATFETLSEAASRSDFALNSHLKPRIAKSGPNCSWLDVDVSFSTKLGELQASCSGIVSVIPDAEGRWRVWMLRTWVEHFHGHGDPDEAPDRSEPDALSGNTDTEQPAIADEYDAAIIGGGQAGLSTAGRLQALGVRYVLLERQAEIGGTWAKRYDSLRWHTSKEYGVLPFGHTFPAADDYSLPAKRIAAGHKAWAEKYGINASTNTVVESARWDDDARKWTIKAVVNGRDVTFVAGSLVLCIGPGHASPVVPDWATKAQARQRGFNGTIVHAFDGYVNANAWAGQRGVVVGTANTAHDVAEDMANAGMATTMLQRSPTFVFPAEWLHAAEDVHYRADTSAEEADKESFTYPNKILREMINVAVWAGIKANPDRFDALEQAGFRLDRYGDTYDNLYIRFGGHYVDIGASKRIAQGEIKIEGRPVKHLTEEGILLEDGTQIGADLVVLATGFDHVFRNDAARIIGRESANRMDVYGGIDAEGEYRGHARPAGHPNLYCHGGDVRMARFFSRFIALQIQAQTLGQPLKPCRD